MNDCIECKEPVTELQEAVLCEECERWQHRECGTGITREEYRQGMEDGFIDWSCGECMLERNGVQPEDDVYAAELGEFVEPANFEEDDLPDPYPQPNPEVQPEDPITYRVVEGASKRGKAKLFDSLGFEYILKVDKRRAAVTWRCAIKKAGCKATVMERNGGYVRGSQEHVCDNIPGRQAVAIIRRDLKERAMEHPYVSAAEMVDEILRDNIGAGNVGLHPSLPTPANLARQANLKRKLTRPQHPTDINFVLDDDHIAPGFLRADLHTAGHRNILLATNDMLYLLEKAKVWYMDGTFKLVKEPFYQLFSINCFIKSGTAQKQVPLMFAVMSGKSREDYDAVLEAVKELVPRRAVRKVVADFEAALWQAVRQNLPNVRVTGCLFHYTQAVFRKVQEYGLQPAYRRDPGTQSIVRKLMTLPFVPVEHVNEVYGSIEDDIRGVIALAPLMQYMRTTWINGNMFGPEDWVVFRQLIRTNNDIEGWHARINHRARRGNLQFYLMCGLLYEEGASVTITAELVHREDVTRVTSRRTRIANARIERLWDEYSRGIRGVHSLMTSASRLIKYSAN